MTVHKGIKNLSTFQWLVISLALSAFVVWLRFYLGPGSVNLFQLLLEALLFSMLSYALIKFFVQRRDTDKKRFRLAFLTAIAVSLVSFFLSGLFFASAWHWGLLIVHLFTIFVTCFIVSNLTYGWWENNAPHSPQIEAEVFASHQEHMGTPIKLPFSKRLFDILFSAVSLILSMPVWLLIIFMIWWEDPGPVLFVKNAVGKNGINFKQLKFRSMVMDAEKDTGPISGYENDDRVLFFGRVLRKTALDELPQLINILMGQMSYVGPRPQRTVLVHGYLQRLPEYARRHLVRPGLAGLAQVADSYDISPEEKLAWDLVYIEKSSLWLDFKLLLSAFLLVFGLRWMSDTDAEAKIRKLLNLEKPAL